MLCFHRAGAAACLPWSVLFTLACEAPPSIPDAGRDGPSEPIAVALTAASGERLTELDGVVRVPLSELEGIHPRFDVDVGIRHQAIVGFGASFLEAGLVALRTLPTDAEEDAVLRALFDPETGAGFTAMKTVIGGTDFQSQYPEWFTYHDDFDPTLASFSVARDFDPAGVGTFIRRARMNGGDFVLQTTLDFPPDWMLVDVMTNQTVQPTYYDELAEYFVRYLEAYEAEGISIEYLSPFNEPGHYTDISDGEMLTFFRDHLAPALAADGTETELMLGELSARSWAADRYPAFMDDPVLGPNVAAMGFHGYDLTEFDRVRELHERYPTIPLWQTEICCAPMIVPVFSFAEGAFYGEQILRDLEAGVSGWLYWNMILDERGGPWAISPVHGNPDGNFQPALVTIHATTHEVTYTGPYWYLAQFSRFVRPNAVRIETTPTLAEEVRAISFENESGELVTVVLNQATTSRSAVVASGGMGTRIELPPGAIATLRWTP